MVREYRSLSTSCGEEITHTNSQIPHHANKTILIPVKHPNLPMPGWLFAFDTAVIAKKLKNRTLV
jgi:hypothetical protein